MLLPYVVRGGGVLELLAPLGAREGRLQVTYSGGYILPGSVPGPGQVALPADVEFAVLEQVAWWFQAREHAGVLSFGPVGGVATRFADPDLLPAVRAVSGAIGGLLFRERWGRGGRETSVLTGAAPESHGM